MNQPPGYGWPPSGYGPPGYPPSQGYPPQPYGYPPHRPPPRKGTNGCLLAFLIVSGLSFLGFVGSAVCVSLRETASRARSAPVASVSASASRPEAPWVAALVQLAANPKSVKATMTGDFGDKPDNKDKNINYDYRKPPGIPAETLYLSVSKANPAAWEFAFEEEGTSDGGAPAGAASIRLEDFAPSGALSKLPHNAVVEFYEITAGPLNGSILEHESGRIAVKSLLYAIGEGIRWVCENRNPGGATWETVESHCRDMVRAKLLSPKSADFPGLLDGTDEERRGQSTPGCGWKWYAWVDAKNAFNATIRHGFTCEEDPKTRTVTLDME